ncbi:MAG: ankyrin repeat domain-containing protein [Pseudomonadota bacterium]
MPKSLDQLRRDAKALAKRYEALDPQAHALMQPIAARRGAAPLKHADFLQAIANVNGFASWPKLVWASETVGLDRAAKQNRLKAALYFGQYWRVEQLLADTPDLADGAFDLEVALLRRDGVEAALAEEPALATRDFGVRRPIVILAFSKHIHARPELEADMLAIADTLVAHGADANDGYADPNADGHLLSALYGAIGHANNMALGRWLLEHGADPNDGESLYHATELGHHDGLKILLDHGADPAGTNALLRAMDFHDVEAVRLLLAAGAHVEDFNADEVGGEKPLVTAALHQAARRMSPMPMVQLLVENGADLSRVHDGVTPYAMARIFGNSDLATVLEARGADHPLNPVEAQLAAVADGADPVGFINSARLPEAARNIVRLILHLPGKLPHVKRLVEAGAEWDRPDDMGLPPVQIAGWEGLPDVMGYFLSLGPDLSRVNNYGGTLLGTIIHGSENNPDRRERDHITCARLALEEGVALPRRAPELAGEPNMAAFLADWAEAHPGQVVERGVV